MLNKFIDLLKEVFWIKSSKKRIKSSRRKVVKKKAIKPKKFKKKIVKKEVLSKAKVVKPALSQKLRKDTGLVIDPALKEVGEITHYFKRINVCVLKLTGQTILIGDKLTIVGLKQKFIQKIWSMQIESLDVKVARKGQLVGLKVDKDVNVGDKVYK
ncbi:MAG: hypothetical protein HQL13_01030 [Candidatus Omnitrophica bacterium]|nr:hypothetical protein [Candidatus Omnitrophota bacterium]